MLKTPMPTMNTSPPRTMKIPMKKPVPSSGVAMVAAVGSQARWLSGVWLSCRHVRDDSQCFEQYLMMYKSVNLLVALSAFRYNDEHEFTLVVSTLN